MATSRAVPRMVTACLSRNCCSKPLCNKRIGHSLSPAAEEGTFTNASARPNRILKHVSNGDSGNVLGAPPGDAGDEIRDNGD